MAFVVKWLPRTGIPTSKPFQERQVALDYACALIKGREKAVELYDNGKRMPGRKLQEYCQGGAGAAD